MKLKSELFPTVVLVDIPFYTEQFPTVNGKMDVHYNDRREKFTFLKIQRHDGIVRQGGQILGKNGLEYKPWCPNTGVICNMTNSRRVLFSNETESPVNSDSTGGASVPRTFEGLGGI